MSTYRIVAIAQIHNELRKGNLRRFLKYLRPLVDEVVIYDDASTDGSFEYVKRFTPHVIRGAKNEFTEEMSHKKQLLAEALKFSPDFVMYLDADEILSANAVRELPKICQMMVSKKIDGMTFKKINLWRSQSWQRVDNAYDAGWFTHLWRVTPGIGYPQVKPGLHQPPYPPTLKKIAKTNKIRMLHYGFSSDEAIMSKYLTYRRHGQTGWTLSRLIDESTLTLQAVGPALFPPKLRVREPRPAARPLPEWHKLIERRQDELLPPAISIVSLIYKSTEWLRFAYEQVLRYIDLSDKELFFVANDATESVKQYLHDQYIPHYVFENTPAHRKEWYINNVYRAWNYAAKMARGDYILFINSDMGFTPNWVENLFKHLDGKNCVASRLVESGKMPSGEPGISKNFGRKARLYDERSFQEFAKKITGNRLFDGGLYMPLLIKRSDFLAVGGYPEGNVVPGSDPWKPKIAREGEAAISGDVILMEKLKSIGIKHQTAFDSVAYHFQEGEMDDRPTTYKEADAEIIFANDLLTGVMGERTMWNVLLERLPLVTGIDRLKIGQTRDIARKARAYIGKYFPHAKIVVQNATFMGRVDPNKYTIVFLQDDLRGMGRPSHEQEFNLRKANLRITNSSLTASSYPEYNFEIIPIGVDEDLFRPLPKAPLRRKFGFPNKKIGIFVGDLSPVKGWPEIKKMIEKNKDIFWIVVSKSDERYEAPNVAMYNKISQELLSELYNCADFFILGSPVETLCLAAIEAAMCNVPVIMHNTGIFADFTEEEKRRVGFFAGGLDDKVDLIFRHTFTPRQVMIERKLTQDDMVTSWYQLLKQALQEARAKTLQRQAIPLTVIVWGWIRQSVAQLTDLVLHALNVLARFTLRIIIATARAVIPRPIYRFLTRTYDRLLGHP
jgi:glycosyltransferase involved in cell wall biosynthesis